MEFERDTRVQHIQRLAPTNGMFGTVTHLPGDPPSTEYPDGFDDEPGSVWVKFDNGQEKWIESENLVVIP